MEPTGGAIADGRGLELATLRRPVVTLTCPVPEIILGRRPYSLGRGRGACGHRDRPCSDPGLGYGRPAGRALACAARPPRRCGGPRRAGGALSPARLPL